MLRDLLAIAESDTFGRADLESACWSREDLELRFRVDPGRGPVQRWVVQASAVLEYSLQAAVKCGFNHWTSDHPALDQYRQPHEQLLFRGRPASVRALIGDLWCAHRRVCDDWISFDRYLNRRVPLSSLLESGSGLLLEGPSFLAEAFVPVLLAARAPNHSVGIGRRDLRSRC